ncbi:MAG TPA: hypothetical protein VIJ25_02580 [Methylococcales bacterium]
MSVANMASCFGKPSGFVNSSADITKAVAAARGSVKSVKNEIQLK